MNNKTGVKGGFCVVSTLVKFAKSQVGLNRIKLGISPFFDLVNFIHVKDKKVYKVVWATRLSLFFFSVSVFGRDIYVFYMDVLRKVLFLRYICTMTRAVPVPY